MDRWRQRQNRALYATSPTSQMQLRATVRRSQVIGGRSWENNLEGTGKEDRERNCGKREGVDRAAAA